MAGAAILRSVATKMARAPPRLLPSSLEHYGRLPTSSCGLWHSRFSTSTGSKPPLVNLRDPQSHNKKVPNELDWFIAGMEEAAPKAAIFLVFSGLAFLHFYVNPALDRIEARMNARSAKLSTMAEEFRKENERIRASMQLSKKENQLKELEASIKDLKAEITELKIALELACSQGKV